MTDTPLLDWIPAHQKHSATSRAAAEAIKPRIGPMHRAILEHLRETEAWASANLVGSTDEEMQRELDMPGSTQRPRRRELQNADLIIKSGTTRKTQSGRLAVVWMLAPRKSASHPDERAERAT